jgi:hypothetical protein
VGTPPCQAIQEFPKSFLRINRSVDIQHVPGKTIPIPVVSDYGLHGVPWERVSDSDSIFLIPIYFVVHAVNVYREIERARTQIFVC